VIRVDKLDGGCNERASLDATIGAVNSAVRMTMVALQSVVPVVLGLDFGHIPAERAGHARSVIVGLD
ncbi:MAG: hypothetical protein EBU90_30880, partial [Proteobacteria bacterium]|nr:hypothetical protein [Pseudomonadota bacterium]